MTQPAPPKPPASNDGFDFEITDFASARQALDNEAIALAAELARPVDPVEWESRRRPRVATDRALTGNTLDWLMRLPPQLRPRQLTEQFPRLANAVAAAWPEPPRCIAVFDGLLTDERGGRRGLPHEVREELLVLRHHLADRHG